MKELKNIITAYDFAVAQNKKCALATVVHIEGSSYRQPGARMLITEDGMLTGAISGGCLEGDALRKALLVISKGEPKLVTYDTSDEDDEKVGIGLGCNGIIQILIEPVFTSQAANPVELLRTITLRRADSILVTVFSIAERSSPLSGTRLVTGFNPLNVSQGVEEPIFDAGLRSIADNQLAQKQSAVIFHNDHAHLQILLSYVPQTLSLVIAGGGNDVIPLTEIADTLGWDITVADGRRNYATAARFPKAGKLLVMGPDKLLENIDALDERTVFLLMTHNYNYDLALLKKLLVSDVLYIGILGPRKKTDKMLGELRGSGEQFSEQQLAKIYGPTGLDTGAENADEIALSICAEINAVMNGRQGSSLRLRTSPIHQVL